MNVLTIGFLSIAALTLGMVLTVMWLAYLIVSDVLAANLQIPTGGVDDGRTTTHNDHALTKTHYEQRRHTMRNTKIYWGIFLAAIALLVLAVSCSAQAASPHTTDTNRQYIERVHGYANGNSLGIQALRRTTNAIEAVNVSQDRAISGKVDKAVFVADQARQDRATASQGKAIAANGKAIKATERVVTRQTGEINDLQGKATQADLGIKENASVNVRQDATLASQGNQLADYANVNAALNTRLGGAYERIENNEARISSLERNQDRNNEAAAIGLAIAGHQFDTKGGFQTAVSISTVNSREALAIGMGGAISERVFVNAGIASSGNTTGGVVSSTFSW